MRQAGRWRRGALLFGAFLLLASCSGGCSSSEMELRFPLLTTRAPVLPEPPLVFSHFDPLSDVATDMTGTLDRLVLAHGNPQSGISNNVSDPPRLRVTVFDFGAWRWRPLPNARYSPVALPDGLASVGLSCGAEEDSNARCQVVVSTLRWADRSWSNQQVTQHAEWVHEGGSVDLLGVRGDFAYFQATRESSSLVVRVAADGDVDLLPAVPREHEVIGQPITASPPVTCVTPDGLETLRTDLGFRAAPVDVTFGPVLRLDDQSEHPRWRTVPETTPLVAPGAGADRAFVCGPNGLVLLHSMGTSALIGHRFVALSSAPTPPFPNGPLAGFAAMPTLDGGLVYSDYRDLHRLRNGVWQPPILQAAKHPWSTVGELVAYQVINPTTKLLEFHVTR